MCMTELEGDLLKLAVSRFFWPCMCGTMVDRPVIYSFVKKWKQCGKPPASHTQDCIHCLSVVRTREKGATKPKFICSFSPLERHAVTARSSEDVSSLLHFGVVVEPPATVLRSKW